MLESGLQYEILTEGTGEIPTSDKQVRVHYHGELTDGTVFDSSVSRGQPAEFPVTGVIKGWVEALQLMPVGSKWNSTSLKILLMVSVVLVHLSLHLQH